jgi:hypothetical protein
MPSTCPSERPATSTSRFRSIARPKAAMTLMRDNVDLWGGHKQSHGGVSIRALGHGTTLRRLIKLRLKPIATITRKTSIAGKMGRSIAPMICIVHRIRSAESLGLSQYGLNSKKSSTRTKADIGNKSTTSALAHSRSRLVVFGLRSNGREESSRSVMARLPAGYCVIASFPLVCTYKAVGIGTDVKLVLLLIMSSALPTKFNVSAI